MSNDKNFLYEILNYEKELYLGKNPSMIKCWMLQEHDYQIWKYQEALRKYEFYYNNNNKIKYRFWLLRKNRLGARLGIQLRHNVAEKGLHIWHYGSIIVNGNAKIGKNCQLHGMNCIGNKGDKSDAAPTIGNNVDIGVGAVIIGNIHIADDVKIGANAVVVKSCYERGAVLVGNPARIIIQDGEKEN